MDSARVRFPDHPVMRWLLQPQRIPLLFAVTIISGIFYHYAPAWTPLWIILSAVIIGALFRLFDFVKAHNFLGGIFYCIVGLVFLLLARTFWQLGYSAPFFGPEEYNYQISFFVWFLTPQSVLQTAYPGYTLALYLLFVFFIASITYYFTLVRYRVLMSFMVMIFPFAIYAKENETMPILSIILLFVCYFAVMVYCRQAHAEDSAVVQIYAPNEQSRLTMPSKKSAFAGIRPELLDGKFIRSAGIFITAATITVLILPKPTVEADRDVLDTMIDMSALTDYLENAIKGFTDTSDGGSYTPMRYSRALYFARGDETPNLKVLTLTHYSYETDAWSSSSFDRQPQRSEYYITNPDTGEYFRSDAGNPIMRGEVDAGLYSLSTDQRPDALINALQHAAQQDPDFAARWNLQTFAGLDADSAPYYTTMEMQSAGFDSIVYPVPNYVRSFHAESANYPIPAVFASQTGVIFRYEPPRIYNAVFDYTFLSERYSETDAVQTLMHQCSTTDWHALLLDADRVIGAKLPDDLPAITAAQDCYYDAMVYAETVKLKSETPDSVRELAEQLTAGCDSDFDKVEAIYDYLKFGEYVYSLDYQKGDRENVETFLFETKQGVCYEFASAFTELVRAVGLPARFIEGYAVTKPYERLGGNWDYTISTDQSHAWSEVYISGYGWASVDATAGNGSELGTRDTGRVTVTLQYSGLILLAAVLAALAVIFWIIPPVREALFRRRYKKRRNAAAVQDAMQRLLKQWHADPAKTARAVCAEQADFLGVDLTVLLEGFEEAVYAGRCSEETADRVFKVYCAAHDAYRPAVKRVRKAKRAERKRRKQAAV